MKSLPRVTVWNEYLHEKQNPNIAKIYPNGIHEAIAGYLRNNGFDTQTATLEQPAHGLSEVVLDNTDVLIWWGHMAHDKVSDEIIEKVHKRVVEDGMGSVSYTHLTLPTNREV